MYNMHNNTELFTDWFDKEKYFEIELDNKSGADSTFNTNDTVTTHYVTKLLKCHSSCSAFITHVDQTHCCSYELNSNY